MMISVPAMAGSLVKTEDGMLTMELPEKGWHEIYEALQTIEFDVLPEEVVKENKEVKKTYSVEAADKTMYACAESGLNIRKGYGTTTEVIGTYGYAEKVHVTGYVKCDGENLDGRCGYVNVNYIF